MLFIYSILLHSFHLSYPLYILLFILKLISCGKDPIQLIDQPNYTKHHRLSRWNDINESDVKIFLAHVIVMGLV